MVKRGKRRKRVVQKPKCLLGSLKPLPNRTSARGEVDVRRQGRKVGSCHIAGYAGGVPRWAHNPGTIVRVDYLQPNLVPEVVYRGNDVIGN